MEKVKNYLCILLVVLGIGAALSACSDDEPKKQDSSHDAIPHNGALDLDGYVLTSVNIADQEYTFEYDSKGRLIKTSCTWLMCEEPDVNTIDYEKGVVTYSSEMEETRYQAKFKPTGQITYLKDFDSPESWTLEYDTDNHLQKVVYIDSDSYRSEIDLTWDKNGALPSIDFNSTGTSSYCTTIEYGNEMNPNGQFSYSLSCALGKNFDTLTGLILAGLFGKAPVMEIKEIEGNNGVFFHTVNQHYNDKPACLSSEYLDEDENNSYYVEYNYRKL